MSSLTADSKEQLVVSEELASEVVERALRLGATDAECTLAEGEEFSVSVRMREIESLKEAGSRGAGLRVLLGKCPGSSYTSDLSADGIEHMIRSALELARIATEDPHAGLPEREELGSYTGDLQLYTPDLAATSPEERINLAREAEEAALSRDPRIANSEGASFGSHVGLRVFANSRGFSGSYRYSSCSVSAVPIAQDEKGMERDYWYSSARALAGLEPARLIGEKAADRALRRLGSRKVPTQKASIIFEPRTAQSLLGDLFDAVNGSAIYRNASFLAGKLGERIASESVTLIDDATLPGLFGSSPFDDEGAPSRRTVVVERGILRSYLLNAYSARKLGLRTTGNSSRGLTGNAGVGHGNFFLEPGQKSPEELIRGVSNGFYVTELIGSGVNTVTGDYSQGAAGIWIENGELTYPVAEVTIASTMQEMLANLQVASDLEFRSSIASPTLLAGDMTISGA